MFLMMATSVENTSDFILLPKIRIPPHLYTLSGTLSMWLLSVPLYAGRFFAMGNPFSN